MTALCAESGVRLYQAYVDYLHKLVDLHSGNLERPSSTKVAVDKALNGQAYSELIKLVPLEFLKQDGVFFTGSELSEDSLLEPLKSSKRGSVYVDPACGAGDLLVKCAEYLPLASSLEDTLKIWGTQLIGIDIHQEFIDAAKARIVLMAIQRGGFVTDKSSYSLTELFPNIRKCNSLTTSGIYNGTSHIVMNPPFTLVDAPDDCSWSSGKLTLAGIFVEDSIKKATKGTRITAILPEVLRTGSRYKKWRGIVSSSLKIHSISRQGQFDNIADVDVFVLDATVLEKDKGDCCVKWWSDNSSIHSDVSIDDLFIVRVGTVVPHRDTEEGAVYPYIHAKSIPPWSEYSVFSERRQYKGPVFTPPFVTIRRTSSPRDCHRATASLVLGQEDVAVENHLIVLKPRNGSVELCRQALHLLRSPEIDIWLNERISCRHLTVSAVKEIPWIAEVK